MIALVGRASFLIDRRRNVPLWIRIAEFTLVPIQVKSSDADPFGSHDVVPNVGIMMVLDIWASGSRPRGHVQTNRSSLTHRTEREGGFKLNRSKLIGSAFWVRYELRLSSPMFLRPSWGQFVARPFRIPISKK